MMKKMKHGYKTKPRQGQRDMGHDDGAEYINRYNDYIEMKFDPNDFDENERGFIGDYQNTTNYHPEDCHGNRIEIKKKR